MFNANLNGGNVFNSSLIIGGIGGTAGSVQMTGGTLNIARQLAVGGNFGEYAGFSQSAGTTTLGGFLALGLGSDQSVFNLTGGTFGFTNLGAAPPMTIGAGTTATYTGIGIATVSGSAVLNNTNADGSGGILWIGETARGEFNLLGSAAVNLTNSGVIICKGNGAGQAPSGTLNLNGGTLTTTRIFKTATGGSSTLNFNGGTLKASAANSAFISGLGSVAIYTNGATIDDSGFAVTLAQPLLAPAGYGVLSISLSSGGSGYIDSPIVTISGGTGSNATAIATVVGGVVTGLTVTSPGTGYNVADVLTASLSGGGGSGASPNTPVLVVNFGGGLTKKGAGTTSLAGVDTYTGTTAVSAGTLLVTPLHQVTGAVTVASNATYGVSVNVGGAATNGNLTLGSTALDITTLSFGFSTGTNPTSAVLQTGTLTRNGTNRIRLSGLLSAGTFPLVKYSGALAGSGVILTNALVAHGIVATISNDVANSTLYAVVTGTAGIVWQGYNTAPALTNLWNLNSATNWLSAGSPSDYTEVTPPGDPVLFDDTGSGLVLLSNTVSPAGLLLTNNAVSYTFQGSARIAGTTSLIKMGTGTATVTLTNGNNYTGNTIISNGTLQCGTAVTIPDGTGSGSTIIGSAGTLQLNGFSETLNGLVGSGVIDNSGGGAVTLTVGNGGGSAPWAGTITNTGAGAVNILKTGTGSMTISGTNYLGGGNSQMNGGTNFLTATGRIEPVGTGEFWVMQNAGTARMEINGGSLNVNSWLVIGRNIATANGTLVINSGTVQKGGANNVVVGSLNATGRLEVNGGQLLNNGNLWLGENASANATLQLNGGLVQATQVRPQGVNPVLSVAYFNGGIMQAYTNSDDFFGTNATAMRTTLFVSSGGLYFDTQSFSVTNQSDLLDDGSGLGGLVKLGSGLLAINSSASTYVGVTTVSNGTLNVNGTIPGAVTVKSGATLGGNGTIGGVVTVSAGGTLGAGASIGLLTLGSSPVLGGSVVAEINNAGPVNDQIVVTALPITYAGALVVSNVGAVLTTNDTFTLFTASAHSGAFTTITNTGTPLDPGLGLRFTNGVLSVVSTSPSYATNPTNLTSVVSGSTLTLSWPADHLGWFLQTQTNSRALGLKTNWFDVAGSDTNTTTAITMDKASPTVFFRLRYP